MQADPEKILYTIALYDGTGIEEPDYLATVDDNKTIGAKMLWNTRFSWDRFDEPHEKQYGSIDPKPRVAASSKLETVASVTLDPIRDELFVAIRGLGATLNGAPIQVAWRQPLAKSQLPLTR